MGQPAPDYTKARQLRRVEEERLKEGNEIVASGVAVPDWLSESRGRTGGYTLSKKEILRIRESLLEERFGFIEPDPGGSPRWVKGFRLENGETRELRIGGQGLLFLNRRNRATWRDTWRREETALATQEKNLLDEIGRRVSVYADGASAAYTEDFRIDNRYEVLHRATGCSSSFERATQSAARSSARNFPRKSFAITFTGKR